jgi:hypothetical protein
MRKAILVLLIIISALSFSQTRNIRVNIYKLEISQEQIHIDLNSQAENLDLCSVQVLDSANSIVRTGSFPKASPKPGIKQWTANTFPISDLPPGKYTLIIYIGREEMYKRFFSRPAVRQQN